MSDQSFLYRDVPSFKKRVHRVGLSVTYGIEEAGVRRAFERGVNYVMWTALKNGALVAPLKEQVRRDRDRLVIATGPTVAMFGWQVRRDVEGKLRELGTDYLDIYQLFWLGVTSGMTDGIIQELIKLREEGKVRALGCSIHDRPRAGRLAEDSALDMLMIRYNAAHPGAERDIFPHLERRHPGIVAYTATAWRKLLKRPSGWQGDVATAGDCYRFCLSSPHVDVVLMGPKTGAEFDENLDAIEKGPLDDARMTFMRELGKAAHG